MEGQAKDAAREHGLSVAAKDDIIERLKENMRYKREYNMLNCFLFFYFALFYFIIDWNVVFFYWY